MSGLAAIKHWFTRAPRRFGVGAILLTGVTAGIIFWGGFNTFVEYTNTLDFCNSRHEMRDTVYAEYKETVHFSNPSGVRVVCAGCHVPREWEPK